MPCRSVSQRSLGAVETPRHSTDDHAASAAADHSAAAQDASPLTHPSSAAPAAELEAALERQTSSVPAAAEAAGLRPAWLDTELGRPPAKRRSSLPKPKQKLPSINIFNIVRDWIGEPYLPCFCGFTLLCFNWSLQADQDACRAAFCCMQPWCHCLNSDCILELP